MSTIGRQKQLEYRLGRYVRTEIATGADLITALIGLCKHYAIKTGRFCLAGRVQSATIGVYDQSQEVYVTHLEENATEVLSCAGSVTIQGKEPTVNAKIILADQQGQLTGGHLFENTISHKVEIDIQELIEIE